MADDNAADDGCYWTALSAAIRIADMLGPWPGMERPLVIGRITFLLLDLLKGQAVPADATYDLD